MSKKTNSESLDENKLDELNIEPIDGHIEPEEIEASTRTDKPNENVTSDTEEVKEEADTQETAPEQKEPENKDEQEKYKKLSETYLNQLQRLQAEFDNYRKREEKNRLGYKDLITENVIVDLLPVIDNFERAIDASKNPNTTLESFVEGIKLVTQQFDNFLSSINVQKMKVLGEKFDPAKHDAVSKMPSVDYEEDFVAQVLQNGWSLNDKVIRHAMVVVSSEKIRESKNEK
ncbi:MAG: hypothetical protein ACD_79C00777G0001 [uncultured bacterium]|nr:MAG: hypothetical protein ACD_79C00777G0001 [uncultured bacterium]